jgi:hypothetical protein
VRPVSATSSPRRSKAPAGSAASRSTAAPYPRVAAILASLAPRHMTTSASIPSLAAPHASACAWFPAEIPITPRARSSGVSDESLLRTPRTLNDPVRWKSSAFSQTRSPSVREPKVGVRCTRPRIRSAAASTSSRVTAIHRRS